MPSKLPLFLILALGFASPSWAEKFENESSSFSQKIGELGHKLENDLKEGLERGKNYLGPKGHLKVGLGPSATMTKSKFGDLQSPLAGMGALFEIGVRLRHIDLSLGSIVNYSKIHKLHFQINESKISADGTNLSISYGPLIRWYSQKEIFSQRELSLVAGPLIGMHTLKVVYPTVEGGKYTPARKITSEGVGFTIGVGFERFSLDKYKHDFFHIDYKFLQSQKLTEVGGDSTEVDLVHQEIQKKNLTEHSILFSFGGVVF